MLLSVILLSESQSPPHPPWHRGRTYFCNKSMLRTYYVQKTYYSVIITDLVPAHTAHSLVEEIDVIQRITQIHNSDVLTECDEGYQGNTRRGAARM